MPELPEVETVVRDLRPYLVGCRIHAVRCGKKNLRRRWQASWTRALTGKSIHALQRRGKWILVDLDGPWLVLHLGMTGQLRVFPSRETVQPHTHLIFTLDNGKQLRFRDVRRFGSATLFPDKVTLDAHFQEAALGPEPFDLEPAYWHERLTSTRRCLKAILLDQRVVAGVGNIYADESLFEAHLHPSLPGPKLRRNQTQCLHQAVVTVLTRAIELRGSSIRDYFGGSGEKGSYQQEFLVYGRTGEPCVRCRRPIERIVLAGRSTHFCPRCQKPPAVGR